MATIKFQEVMDSLTPDQVEEIIFQVTNNTLERVSHTTGRNGFDTCTSMICALVARFTEEEGQEKTNKMLMALMSVKGEG